MRTPKYLSPTSLKTFEGNPIDFYINYLADDRPERCPQTVPMAVGSSFDAYCKSYLHEALFGRNVDPKFGFTNLFEAQVETQNRDRALLDGAWAFKQYKQSGALADIILELNQAIGRPTFEFDVLGAVNGYREGVTIDLEVPIFGKPDVRFINREGCHVIYDWKVNGYYSKGNTSPKPKYVKILDGWLFTTAKNSRNHNMAHPDTIIREYKGMRIGSHFLEEVDPEWADQLATYAWLMGEPVGSETIVGIDQLCCADSGTQYLPMIRVAQHRARISENWQFGLLKRYQDLWNRITSGHYFSDLSLEESIARCKELDNNGLKLTPNMSEEEKAKIRLMRS